MRNEIESFKNKLTYHTSTPLLENPSTGKKDASGGKAATVTFANLYVNKNVDTGVVLLFSSIFF